MVVEGFERQHDGLVEVAVDVQDGDRRAFGLGKRLLEPSHDDRHAVLGNAHALEDARVCSLP